MQQQRAIPKEWSDLTQRILAAAIEVHPHLGPGQLENMYEAAMAVELRMQGLEFARQRPIRMKYKGVEIGDLRLDLVVADTVIVELKAIERVAPVHCAQLVSYLRSADLRIGLLINFNHTSLMEGVTRRLNASCSRVRSLPPLASPLSPPSEFLPEDAR